MKSITQEQLERFNKQYKNNTTFNIVRHALSKNSISNIAYVNEQEKETQNHFTIDLNKLPILNQGKSRRCWIYSGLELFRKHITEKYNVKDFVLSANYISFYDKLEKANYFIETMIELKDKDMEEREVEFMLRKGIRDGGYWQNFVNLVTKYGIVPDYAFPETYSSSNTMELNQILSKYLRKFTIDIREKQNVQLIEEIKQKTMQDIYNILCNCQGIPPEHFNFEYTDNSGKSYFIKDITPLEFLNKYIEKDINDYCDVINYPNLPQKTNHIYNVEYLYIMIDSKENIFLNLEYDRLEELIIKQITDGEMVYFSCENGKYINNEQGIWNDKQYDYETLFQIDLTMGKSEMLDTRECYFGHTMIITGIELENNKIKKFKVKNSWGKTETNSGYWVVTPTWMKMYLYEIAIKEKYLTTQEKELFKAEPYTLNIWNPLAELT